MSVHDVEYCCDDCDDDDGGCNDDMCDCHHPRQDGATVSVDVGAELVRPTAPTVHDVAPRPRPITEVWVLRDPQSRAKLSPSGVRAIHATEQECIDAGLQAIADGHMSSFMAQREFYGPRWAPQ